MGPHRNGELSKRADELWQLMENCTLCPRECKANRLAGKQGDCRASSQLEIASYHPHFGEERPLVGRGGSGTIFLSHCSLRCVFCINWDISHCGHGNLATVEEMADMMLDLQDCGCANINVVTPTHYAAHTLKALDIAAGKGLRLPLVYNSFGWERLEILRQLDGVVDIYLPDLKYADSEMAATYSSGAWNYPEIAQAALVEMHRQVGVARPAADGLIYRGLMIRHLVMPNQASGTRKVIEWIAQNLPKETYLNLMSQYVPDYKAGSYPQIARKVSRGEYAEAVQWAKDAGLTNVDVQGYHF
ncbi:MAG: radical SAM protein [Acidobacteria bacterium]|nr:MAG: radical SAM protein [Acidobacteriota bacterium]